MRKKKNSNAFSKFDTVITYAILIVERKDDEISKLRKENEKLKKEMKKVKSTKGWAKYKAKNIKSRAKKKIK